MAQEIVFLPAPRFSGMAPYQEKSIFRKFLDTVSFGGTNKLEHAAENQFGRKRVATGLEVFRENSEAAFAGAVLGALNGSGNIEVGGFPVDGCGAVVGALGKVFCGADSGAGKTLGDLGMSCTTVYWFRQGDRWARARRGSTHHGDYNPEDADVGSDPVVEAAKQL